MAKRKTKQQRIGEEVRLLAETMLSMKRNDFEELVLSLDRDPVYLLDAAAILHRNGIRADGSYLEDNQ